jgi:hypothetical protein
VRFHANRKVFRCRRRVKSLINIAHAEYILSNPKVPKQKIRAQPNTRALRANTENAISTFDPEEKGGSPHHLL